MDAGAARNVGGSFQKSTSKEGGGYLELSRNDLDVAVKSELSTTSTSTEVVDSRHGPQERKRGYSVHYYHAGKAICETTFMALERRG